MKKIFTLLLSLFCFAPLSTKMASPQPGGAMLPMPSQEEMQEIQKFLDTLSQDELDELAKIGEEIIQTAEKEGRPLFGPAPEMKPISKPQPKPANPINTAPVVKPTEQVKPTERTLSSKEKSRIQRILSGLVDAIASIRQKATSDETLLQLLAPLNTTLNDITYYLNVVNYSKHLVQLTDKEFTPLNDNLRKFYEQVEEIDSDLDVPELEMSKKQSSDEIKTQRYKIKKATKVLQKFVSIIETTIKQKHVMTDLERLVEKYEPEALKIKQEQEAKEKKASAQRISLPVTNTSQIYKGSPGAARGTQQYTRYPGNRTQPYSPAAGYPRSSGVGPSFPGAKASPSNKTPHTTNTPGAKMATGEAAAKDKNKETVKSAPVPKLTEVEKTQGLAQGIKERMTLVNQLTGIHRDKLIELLDIYLPSAGEVDNTLSEDYRNIIEDISFELFKVKKDVTSWITKIENQATNRPDFDQHRRQLKTYMESAMREVNEFHKKIKSNPGLLTGASPRVVQHREHINQLVKHVDEINKKLTKPQ